METIVLFDEFEFPIIKGLEYLKNDKIVSSDYLFINELNDGFSMYFEKDFPIFNVPQNLSRNYALIELKRENKNIKFFCPEKQKNSDSAVWYFYVEIVDDNCITHILPGQVRVTHNRICNYKINGIPRFVDILEKVKIHSNIYHLTNK